MKYIGIDLGTTNSAICSFDGENLHLYKSPEQHDVTPSAIFIDKRGRKYLGFQAYNNAARNPDNAAVLFKRLMGTSTPIKLSAANLTMTPEECSAEILRVLYGYLPEEIRNGSETGTVITVPAAFNQMQKDATMSAAEQANLGRVALMQKPVAAVMSIMRHRKSDGIFLVYDLGGGTLDIAIAESITGHVNLLAHGGIAMCGGRDFDRMLFDNVVKSWLLDNFDLPDDLSASRRFTSLRSMATRAAEKAKIALSAREDVLISDPDFDGMNFRDLSDKDVYLDIPIERSVLDGLIARKIDESIQAARDTIEKAGLSSHDIQTIVFVGGPTLYKPLRDKVAFELGLKASTEVNLMTAVAEGAAIFAESIDWSSQSRGRKNTRGSISAGGTLDVSFKFNARTPDTKAKIVVKLGRTALQGAEFQIDSLDTGWSSGRLALKNDAEIEVSLSKPGEHTFKVHVFDTSGGPVSLENNKVVITRTAATIDAIPASSSIGIEALNNLGGCSVLVYLVKEGDSLPKKGKETFRAAESLRAGSSGSLNFVIREGEIQEPITDNEVVGEVSVTGADFDEGVINAGAELICEYEMLDSGNLVLTVSVPSIRGTFRARNFYSRKGSEIDYTSAAKRVMDEGNDVRGKIDAVAQKVDNAKLDEALEKLNQASEDRHGESDPETTKQAMDNVRAARKLLAQVRKEHLPETRQLDLDDCIEFFNEHAREHARPTETSTFDKLARTAQKAIEDNRPDFETLLSELRSKTGDVLRRQDWFVVDVFKWLAGSDHLFLDKHEHTELVVGGKQALRADDMNKLRQIVDRLNSVRIGVGSGDDMLAVVNIVRR